MDGVKFFSFMADVMSAISETISDHQQLDMVHEAERDGRLADVADEGDLRSPETDPSAIEAYAEARRAGALQLAVGSISGGASDEQIIARAEAFHTYLTGNGIPTRH